MRSGSSGCKRAFGLGITAVVAAVAATLAPSARANPYASNVSIDGTTVNFILNEPADQLQVSVNGGAATNLDGSSIGSKSFTLSSPTDTFSITAKKSSTSGYALANGTTIAISPNGLSQPANGSGFNLISSDSNSLNKFNSPRGVTVSQNPNAINFGTAYVSNSAAGTTAGRTLGDGLYALRADQSDAFNYGDSSQSGGLPFDASASSPFRIFAGRDGMVYISDFSDNNGQVSRLPYNLVSGEQVLAGIGGPFPVPAGQNHGSTTAVYVENAPGGGLTVYTVDEDLTTNDATGSGSTTDRNSLWKYSIGTAPLPYSDKPTRVNNTNVLVPLATSDMERGADGKFYLAQNRSAGNEAGLAVLSPTGDVVFDSLTASRALLNDPAAKDIVRNVLGMAVSPDQKFVAVLLNNSDVAVIPMVDGIPDLSKILDVDTGTDINSGRDIAFDAADNIHYVSSGQGLYRVLSPGGDTVSTLSYDGSNYSFTSTIAVPEPATLGLLGLALAGLGMRRRRR